MTIVVIGIGNDLRGDDAAGPATIAALVPLLPPPVRTLVLDGDPGRLLAAWQDTALAVVVDSARSGAAPGTVHRIEVTADGLEIPGWGRSGSTHALGVAEAVALGRALDRLPRRLVVYGIEGARFETGTTPGPAVAAAARAVTSAVAREVRAELARSAPSGAV